MADTYAVVQKRRAPPSTGAGAAAPSPEERPVYSQVMPRARRPQAPAEDAQWALPGCAPADPGLAGPGTYEDVASVAQTGGLGFNVRVGKPKGPRDPPAEWTQA
ncbi:tyrosine-protein phosphatase non-receptor type 18 [Pteronotus mesoamericanus]|uniref:tyrosine-protein phosphatase non-receptor type 18 n=1 Tax=Pteronotus mesoamericanus TaxID=1884717 RepID=UPI0023ECF069|nr:tyrosine-protein phosphatase non-receptor type 18 [Pteronotus parnellii mesoamericanus]